MKESESLAPGEDAMARIRSEAADVTLYLAQLADKLGFDLIAAATHKIEENRQRYPAEQARGSAKKYSQY